MGDALIVRAVSPDDAGVIATIYAPYVRDSVISFELEPPGEEEMRRRIVETSRRFPWLVAEEGGIVLGYAYGSSFRTRAAYDWIVETTVYVAQQSARRGIGRTLYAALLDALKARGFCAVIGVIALPNDASVGLHEAIGFVWTGTNRKVGFKFGEWHDVGTWQLDFGERPALPTEVFR